MFPRISQLQHPSHIPEAVAPRLNCPNTTRVLSDTDSESVISRNASESSWIAQEVQVVSANRSDLDAFTRGDEVDVFLAALSAFVSECIAGVLP